MGPQALGQQADAPRNPTVSLGWMSRAGYRDDNENGLAFSRSFDWVE
jgi:hypothetical protein